MSAVRKRQQPAPAPPGSLRVWWIPRGFGYPFRIPVADLACAKLMLRALAAYDEFRCEHVANPNRYDRGGLEVYSPDGWREWHNADGNDIRWVMADGEAA